MTPSAPKSSADEDYQPSKQRVLADSIVSSENRRNMKHKGNSVLDSTILFDHESMVLHDRVPIAKDFKDRK